MSAEFREYLKKIGSGLHTGKHLTREEAASAMDMMLSETATPAQIGAFLIAHRMQRPIPAELAGFLDTYDKRATVLGKGESPVTVLGCPYDGRSRTTPVTPLIVLALASLGFSVITHGGDRMPTKYGIPMVEVWRGLGVDWTSLSIDRINQVFHSTGIGFAYQPWVLPEASALVAYRDQIGKRPPVATMELMWSPYRHPHHVVSGFVHPPTETLFRETFALREQPLFTTVKGLEGSCDLPRSRTAIVGLSGDCADSEPTASWQRLHLHARDYGLGGPDVLLESEEQVIRDLRAVIAGKETELTKSAVWTVGFYIWRTGVPEDLKGAIEVAKTQILGGKIAEMLQRLQEATSHEIAVN